MAWKDQTTPRTCRPSRVEVEIAILLVKNKINKTSKLKLSELVVHIYCNMNPNPPTDMSDVSPVNNKCRETVAIMLGETANISKLNIEQNEIVEHGTIVDKNGDSGKVVASNTSDKTAVLDNTANVATKPPTTAAAAAIYGNNQQAPIKANSNDNNIMSMNNTTTNTNKTTESSSPRRRIVKKRSDDFVYASDNKKLKSTATTTEKSIAASSATNTNNIALQQPQTKQPQVQQQQQKKPRKRPRKCPVKDTILIDIPLSISVDLGVAMKRTRRKVS